MPRAKRKKLDEVARKKNDPRRDSYFDVKDKAHGVETENPEPDVMVEHVSKDGFRYKVKRPKPAAPASPPHPTSSTTLLPSSSSSSGSFSLSSTSSSKQPRTKKTKRRVVVPAYPVTQLPPSTLDRLQSERDKQGLATPLALQLFEAVMQQERQAVEATFSHPSDHEGLDLSFVSAAVDSICHRFEAELRANHSAKWATQEQARNTKPQVNPANQENQHRVQVWTDLLDKVQREVDDWEALRLGQAQAAEEPEPPLAEDAGATQLASRLPQTVAHAFKGVSFKLQEIVQHLEEIKRSVDAADETARRCAGLVNSAALEGAESAKPLIKALTMGKNKRS